MSGETLTPKERRARFAMRKELLQRRAGQEAWQARQEVLQDNGGRRNSTGSIACPVCGGKLHYHVRPCGRVFGKCVKGCVNLPACILPFP